MKSKIIFSLLMALFALGLQAQDLKIHVDDKGRVGFADSKGNVVVSFTIYLQQSIGNTDKGE